METFAVVLDLKHQNLSAWHLYDERKSSPQGRVAAPEHR